MEHMNIQPDHGPRRRRNGPQSRQRPALAATRLTEEEMARLRAAAQDDGKSVSEYVRSLVLTATA